ncbi:MAG: hypothetical protein ACK4UY_04125 [Dietzia sp.]
MQTECPDHRLDYIVEGVLVQGARVQYESVESDDPGWVIHVFDPERPSAAMFTYPVREADVSDNDKRLGLRQGLDSHWRRCYMD